LITGAQVISVGNVSGGNINTVGLISATGNIIGGNLSGTSIVGTLTTAAQTNITSVGTLDSLAVTGNVVGGNLITNSGFVFATGNITGGNLNAAGLSLSGNVLSAINMIANITTTANVNANNISATTSINIAGAQVATIDDAAALAIALG
jgi:hypothetical protein